MRYCLMEQRFRRGPDAGSTPAACLFAGTALFRFSPLVGGRAFARAAVKLFNDGIDQRQLLIGGTGKAFYPGQKKIRMDAGNLVFQRMPTLRSRRIMDNQFYRSSSQKQAPPKSIKQTKRQRPYPLWFCGASTEALTQAYACEAAERRDARLRRRARLLQLKKTGAMNDLTKTAHKRIIQHSSFPTRSHLGKKIYSEEDLWESYLLYSPSPFWAFCIGA